MWMNGSNKARDVFNFEEIVRGARWARRRMGEWCFENATAVS